jgi:DNA adenine methylase
MKKGKNTPYREVVNDINGDLINLHRVIRSRPQSLSYYLNQMLISREIFEDIKSSKVKPRNNIERASFYYYQLQQSFGAKGEHFAMSAKGRKPKNIYKDFYSWSKRLKLVTIENMSFEKVIKEYDKEESFFYLDPPYVSTEKLYKNIGGFGVKEHELLARLLKNIKGKFLLSYNDCSLVRELYKDFNIGYTGEVSYTLGKNFHKKDKVVRELFIKNY